MLAFGGSRTFHRIAVAIEDAGWEIRDVIMWLYSSGMPKSMEAGKLIDKAAGVEREVVGKVIKTCDIFSGTREREVDVTLPATNAAKKWQGWGTTIRPAYEPIIVARNPFEGTIADNVLRRGTGVLNIDGCRIQTSGESAGGRFPANVIHDGSPEVLDAFPIASEDQLRPGAYLGGAGSAARFFYCCKAEREEFNDSGVLDNIEIISIVVSRKDGDVWVNVGQEVRLRVDTGASTPRVIDVSGMGAVSEWSTMLFGKKRLDESHQDTGFIIEMADPSIIGWQTLSWLQRLFTNASTPVASSGVGSGGSPVASVGRSTPYLTITSTRSESLPGVGLVASPMRLRVSGVEKLERHPTVKPLSLMSYLCKLVTPVGGVVLDPFSGSGSTGVAALQQGFDFIGTEKDPHYANDICNPRLEAVLKRRKL
jgi:hypothetical protein